MNFKNNHHRYGIVIILTHWLMAVVVIALFVLGEYMVDLTYYDKWYHIAPWWHKSIGFVVLVLLLLRLFWQFINPTPKPLASYKIWEIKIALGHPQKLKPRKSVFLTK